MGHLFGDKLTPDEFYGLVSPLVPDREEALAITWGGAARCAECCEWKRNLQRDLNEKLTGCYLNNYESCKFPAPPTVPGLRPLWDVWRDTAECVKRSEMSGAPTGKDWGEVRVIAEAHCEPVDATFIRRFRILIDAMLLHWAKANPKKP